MKKEYMKPSVEVEVYSLSASIAGNCGTIISLGPEDFTIGKEACDEFRGSFEVMGGVSSPMLAPSNKSFYESSTECDCYYTASGNSYFTS